MFIRAYLRASTEAQDASRARDPLAAIARKDYEQRRERQAQGIERAKQAGKYQGRPIDREKHKRIIELLDAGLSIRKVAEHARCSTSTVQAVKQAHCRR